MSFLAYLSPFMQGILEPSLILYAAVKAYVEILCQDMWTHRKLPNDVRNRAFGKFWSAFSGSPPDPSAPLVGSAALVPPLLAQARGVVLDIGPGSGNLVGYFDAADNQIRQIYGAEPVVGLHEAIRKNIAGTAVGEKYRILPTGASKDSIVKELVQQGALKSAQDDPAIFDTIVCVRVLCSVPDLQATISDLYALLKPGGTLLVCEHVVNKWHAPDGSMIARIAQSIYMLLGWAHFVGDCSLIRDTERALTYRETARWDAIDIKRNFNQSVFTYICGSLRKRDI